MDIIVVGAGGHAKELAFLINRIADYNLIGFVDDNFNLEKTICSKPLLGDIDYLLTIKDKVAIAVGIANPVVKKKIVQKLSVNPNLSFPNLIDSTALIGFNIDMGIGNVLMPHTSYTADIKIGNFNMFSFHTTIGHDSKIGDYNAFYPSVNISGNVSIKNENQFGTGTKIIQGLNIGNENIFGAGAVVINHSTNCGKYVGVPSKLIESWEKDGE